MKIPYLAFAAAIFECGISGKKCMQDGNCTNCLVAAYFCSWDEKQMEKIWDDINI